MIKVENIKPPKIAMAIDELDSALMPILKAGNTAEAAVVRAVIIMGLNRVRQAAKTASFLFFPLRISKFENSTSKIPFFMTMPISKIKPIIE